MVSLENNGIFQCKLSFDEGKLAPREQAQGAVQPSPAPLQQGNFSDVCGWKDLQDTVVQGSFPGCWQWKSSSNPGKRWGYYMTISWDLSCCVEYWGARGKCCMEHGERHVFLNYQQGRFPALPQDNMRGKCFSLANKTALSRKCKKKSRFFLFYQSWKLCCWSCAAWFWLPTHPSMPGAPPPWHLMPFQPTLQQKKCSPSGKVQHWQKPGNKNWRQTNGISDHFFPFK